MNEKKIEELQILEQNIQNINLQKQRFQTELIEIENALNELSKANEETYKIVNGIMFKEDPETLQKDLKDKKEVIDVRIKSIEKEETSIKEKAGNLQKEVMKELK
jgi:prefoldin beta subunit